VDRGQHMRRVSALPPARLDQALGTQVRQQRLEQQRFRSTGDQAAPELREDRGVEAGVGQPQAEEIFPAQAVAHRVSGLAVGEAFGELHDGHQGEVRGRFGRLTILREERNERRITVDGAEGIAHAQVGVAFGESGVGDTGGLFGNARFGRWA